MLECFTYIFSRMQSYGAVQTHLLDQLHMNVNLQWHKETAKLCMEWFDHNHLSIFSPLGSVILLEGIRHCEVSLETVHFSHYESRILSDV